MKHISIVIPELFLNDKLCKDVKFVNINKHKYAFSINRQYAIKILKVKNQYEYYGIAVDIIFVLYVYNKKIKGRIWL